MCGAVSNIVTSQPIEEQLFEGTSSIEGYIFKLPMWSQTGAGPCLIDTYQIADIEVFQYDDEGELIQQLLGIEDQVNFSWDGSEFTVIIGINVDVHR